MAEGYKEACQAVVQQLQRFCRPLDNKQDRQKCKELVELEFAKEEYGRLKDQSYWQWRSKALDQYSRCMEDCTINGRTEVMHCRATCLNPLIQNLWKHTDADKFNGLKKQL